MDQSRIRWQSAKTLELVRAYYRIPDAHLRRRLFDLAKALATFPAARRSSRVSIRRGHQSGLARSSPLFFVSARQPQGPFVTPPSRHRGAAARQQLDRNRDFKAGFGL